METGSKKIVVSLALLSFLVAMVSGILTEVPLGVVLGRSALVAFVFGSVTSLIVFLTERA